VSWSVAFYDLPERTLADVPAAQLAAIQAEHPAYLDDLAGAFELACKLGLASATITGMRAPNPYGDDEVVDVSVRGMMKAADFQEAMLRIIRAGPDAAA
jgi:hypothetical protein